MTKKNRGKLTTHVLDTALGIPANKLAITLWRFDVDGRTKLKSVVTNSDGRCDGPLLEGDEFKKGRYELVFEAGDYLHDSVNTLAEPLFLEQIPIRFGIADVNQHYHVPLLLSPFGYSTYKGS